MINNYVKLLVMPLVLMIQVFVKDVVMLNLLVLFQYPLYIRLIVQIRMNHPYRVIFVKKVYFLKYNRINNCYFFMVTIFKEIQISQNYYESFRLTKPSWISYQKNGYFDSKCNAQPICKN